ncbi:MAG: hypothetical protein ACI9XO_003907 [Paraglaciecola sp.]
MGKGSLRDKSGLQKPLLSLKKIIRLAAGKGYCIFRASQIKNKRALQNIYVPNIQIS